MLFLRPELLWLSACAAVPVLLYILFRRRRTEVDWGSTYILRLALASGRRRTLWRQIVVILVRTLLLAALALAFARPFRESERPDGAGPFPHGQGRLHRVVLLDNSLSMRARHGLGERFDLARETLVELLTSMRAGDVFDLVLLCPPLPDGDPEVRRVSRPPSATEAERLAAGLQPVPTPPRFAAAMRAVTERFQSTVVATRQLVLISDMARADHPAVDDYGVFGEMLDRLEVRTAVLDLGSRDAHNLAVERIGAGAERLLAGQVYNVYVDVMNYSDAAGPPSRIEFLVDGELTDALPCQLPAGHRRTFAFETAFEAGNRVLEARIGPDAYAADNRMERFVHVVPELRVLVLEADGETRAGFERESAFLHRALESAADAPFAIDGRLLKASGFGPAALSDRDAAIVCGGAWLPSLDDLRRFVLHGGGVLFAVGPDVDAERFNRLYGELLPAGLEAPYRETFDPERYLHVQTDDIGTDLLREFRGSENGDLVRARIYNHYRLRDAQEQPESVERILSLSNGDALLLSRTLGRGRVFLWTSTLGGNWTSLPVRQAYIPLVYRLFSLASGYGMPPRNVLPGRPLILEVPRGLNEVFVTTPDSELHRHAVQAAGNQAFVRVEDSTLPGTYVFSDAGGSLLASFSVAMPLAESDLRTLTDEARERCADALRAGWATSRPLLKAALWRPGDGREFTGWFLLAGLGLLLLDALLTRIWFAD